MTDIDQIRKLSPQDGDVLVLPEDTDPQAAQNFVEALRTAAPGVMCIVSLVEVQRLDVAAMNAAGWYRA